MPSLDPQLRQLLSSLRGRVRRYIVADSLLALLALLLSAFWIGLLVDFLPVRLGGTEMPRSARTVLLLVVGIALVVLIARLLIGRLRRPLPDDSLALLVERHHPELGGRLVTAVQLNREHRQGDSHSPALLQQVHAEAARAVGGVDSNRIFRWRPLWKKVGLVVPLALATAGFAAFSPSAFGRAASRLLLLTDAPWPRQARLEMVGIELPAITADESDPQPPKLIEFRERVARLPRGSSGTLRIAAAAENAIVPEVCTAYFTTAGGIQGQANLRRVGRVVDGEQTFVLDGPPLAGLSETVTLSIRGLDARLDDFRIEAVEPPALSKLTVVATDPAYLRPLPTGDAEPASSTRRIDYQAGLRVREGSDTILTAKSSVPLGKVDARMLVAGNPVDAPPVTLSADGSEFSVAIEDFRRPATIIVVPEDREGISAQVPYRYFLGVVADEKPEVEMRLRGIGTAVTPNARIPLQGRAEDDYEIANALVTLSSVATAPAAAAVEPAEGEEVAAPPAVPAPSVPLPIETGRDGEFEMLVDLRELAAAQPPAFPALEPGAAINLLAEASDRYDLDGQTHRSASQLYRLEIVTPENLLALLERRELALRARLEQTIEETRLMRDSLSGLTAELDTPPTPAPPAEAAPEISPPAEAAPEIPTSAEAAPETPAAETPAAEASPAAGGESPQPESAAAVVEAPAAVEADSPQRQRQILRLRTQQIGLQATKTADELQGIATSLDDLLEEMANNRVDSVDRSERIGGGVRDPLRKVIAGDLALLVDQIRGVEQRIGVVAADPAEPTSAAASAQAVQTAEQVLLQLTAILEKMLDLESYNEILDMVRELIENQDELMEETKKEQKRRVLDLFE